MSEQRISVIVWYDPRESLPEEGDGEILAVPELAPMGMYLRSEVRGFPTRYRAWAELPVPSEATIEDARLAIGTLERYLSSSTGVQRQVDETPPARSVPTDRLRALLPGDSA